MHHPGRTGAQCKARYERLLSEPKDRRSSSAGDSQPTPITDRAAAERSEPPVPVGAAAMSSPIPPFHYSPALEADHEGGNASAPLKPSRLASGSSANSAANTAASGGGASSVKRKVSSLSSSSSSNALAGSFGGSKGGGSSSHRMPPPVEVSGFRSGPASSISHSGAQSEISSALSSAGSAGSARPAGGFTAHRAKFSRVNIRLSGRPALRISKGGVVGGGRQQQHHHQQQQVSRTSSLSSQSSCDASSSTTTTSSSSASVYYSGEGALSARDDQLVKCGKRPRLTASPGEASVVWRGGAERVGSQRIHRPLARAPAAPPRPVSSARPGDAIPMPPLPRPFVATSPPPDLSAHGWASDESSDDDDTHEPADPLLQCVGPDGRVLAHDAIAAAGCALDALRGAREQLRDLLDSALCRELGPHLGGSCGLYYPTFSSLDALAAAVNAAPRLASVAVQAHACALALPHARAPGDDDTDEVGDLCSEASSTAAAAAAAGAAAAANSARANGAAMSDATTRRIAVLLAVHEAARADISRHEELQREALRAMRRWEGSGRPSGPGGAMPVFPLYTYTRPLPPVLLSYARPPQERPSHAAARLTDGPTESVPAGGEA